MTSKSVFPSVRDFSRWPGGGLWRGWAWNLLQPQHCFTTLLASRRSLGNLGTSAIVMLTPPWRVVSWACFIISTVKDLESGKYIRYSPWMHPQYSNTPLVFSCRFSCSWSWQTWPSLPLGSALTWSKTFLVAEFLWSQEILLSTWKGGKNYD